MLTEPTWNGKYKDGSKVSSLRTSPPFQDVETVDVETVDVQGPTYRP